MVHVYNVSIIIFHQVLIQTSVSHAIHRLTQQTLPTLLR